MTPDPYNYRAFSFAMEESELATWLSRGPRPGHAAPDFQLQDLDGQVVALSSLRGRPVVIEFGSYTCPIFSDRVPDMERLAVQHPEAEFLVIAIREAHPGEVTSAHRSLARKRQAARCLAMEEGLRRRVLVDDLDGTVHRAYGGAWDPVYVLDALGRVVFRRAWNDPAEVGRVLEALELGASAPLSDSTEMPQLPGRGPMGLRLLERGGRQALLDFYRSAPPPLRARLRQSQSDAVRAALAEEVVRQFYELFGSGEFDQAVALFADDAQFHLPGTNAISGTHRGKSAILAFWRRQLELSRGTFKARLVSMTPKDKHVVVTLALRAEVAGEPVAWGRTVDYRVADGLIAGATVIESDQALADRLFRP